MMKRCPRILQAMLLLVALCGISFFTISPAHASLAPQASLAKNASEVALPTNCYLKLVHLHAKNPATVECKVSGKMTNGQMVPTSPMPQGSASGGRMSAFTHTADCNEWFGASAEIDSATQGRWCFDGSGYLGLSMIHNVTEVHGNYEGGWVMVYKNGSAGFQFSFSSGSITQGPLFDGGDVGITQINLYCSGICTG